MGIVVKRDDSLILTVWSATTNTIRMNVNIRPTSWWKRLFQAFSLALGSGDPYNLVVDVVGAGDRSSSRAVLPISDDGEIDSAQLARIDAGSSIIGPGICFCQGNVSRAFGAGGNNFAELVAGYIYTGHAPSYPGAIEGPEDGVGNPRSIATADPAANAEIANQVCPTNAMWKVRTFSVVLVQGITQTPLPTLRFVGAGGTEAQVPITPTAIGASSTARLTWAIGMVQISFTAVVGDEFHTAPLPEIYLFNPDHFETVTDGIGANTNYGAAVYEVEEWIQPS